MTGAETEGHTVRQVALLHEAGKVAEAAAMYEALLAQHPRDPTLLSLFAVTQLQLGRQKEAKSAWCRSLAIDVPARVRLHILAIMMKAVKAKDQAEGHSLSKAATLHQTGRIAEAAAMYERC